VPNTTAAITAKAPYSAAAWNPRVVRPERERAYKCRRASADISRIVALQLSIDSNKNAVRSRMQGNPGNNDADALPDSPESLKFSGDRPRENVIRSDLKESGTGSVHVLLEPALLLEFRDEADGLVGR
jgi:hypothetical protein